MRKVVLADDDQIFVEGIHKHVGWEELGLTVVGVAYNGLDALNLCKQHQPDILLTDVRMPRINGIEAAIALHESVPGCHIIFMSAYAQGADYRSAIRLKALDFLEKPVDIDDITYALRHAERQLSSQKEPKADAQPSRIIKDVMRQLESRYMENLTVTQLAQMVYFTPNYLSTLFHRETGYTISQYLMLCRVEASIAMLRDSSMSVQEIAAKVGYYDVRHFSKVFQKIMHTTPTAFRKK